MISEAERVGFSPWHMQRYSQATELVKIIPDDYHEQKRLGGGEVIRCHELVRAVGRRLHLPWSDGEFHFREHSWLWLDREILDVYVPGGVPQVQLVAYPYYGLPWISVYHEGLERDDIREGVVEALLALWDSTLGPMVIPSETKPPMSGPATD